MDPSKQTEDEQYVLAGEAVVAPNGGMKRGHKCCGGCCDVKRATIIVNMVSMAMSVLGLITMASVASLSNLTDDSVSYTEEELAAFEGVSGNIGLVVAYTLARMLFNVLGIWGAYSYTVWPVGASLAVFGLEFVSALVVLHLPGAIYYACFAYPHVYLIMEMRNGIMTKETYHNEQHSCCCV